MQNYMPIIFINFIKLINFYFFCIINYLEFNNCIKMIIFFNSIN